jgi:hypothetical protein
MMAIGSDITFNDGLLGCTVGNTGGFNRIWLFVLKQLRI